MWHKVQPNILASLFAIGNGNQRVSFYDIFTNFIVQLASRLKYSISLSLYVRDATVANNGYYSIVSILFIVLFGNF